MAVLSVSACLPALPLSQRFVSIKHHLATCDAIKRTLSIRTNTIRVVKQLGGPKLPFNKVPHPPIVNAVFRLAGELERLRRSSPHVLQVAGELGSTGLLHLQQMLQILENLASLPERAHQGNLVLTSKAG